MELNSKGAINQKNSIKTAKVQGEVLINSVNSVNACEKVRESECLDLVVR